MSDESKEEIDSLFDLEYHEVASVNEDTKVLRVPNGWIYHFNLSGASCSSVFVPEYTPITPQREKSDDDNDLNDEVSMLLNRILGAFDLNEQYAIEINRTIRKLQKRNQPSE